jgi:hypothetical protein
MLLPACPEEVTGRIVEVWVDRNRMLLIGTVVMLVGYRVPDVRPRWNIDTSVEGKSDRRLIASAL